MTKDMTTGSPLKHIISFAIPVFFGMLFQQFYSIADMMVVSWTLGEGALAAVGSTGAVFFLIIGFCMGLSGGFAVHIAQNFGSKNFAELKRFTGNIIWLCAGFSVVVTVLAVIFCRSILVITNTPADIFDMAYNYIIVIFWGIPATFAYNMLSGIMRSLGDSRSPLYILIASSLLNIGLSFMFILAFGWGTMGAALATVISEIGSVIGCLVLIAKRFDLVHISKSDLKPSWSHIRRLLGNGIPMGLLMSLTAIGSTVLQSSVNSLGSVSVAAITAASRFDGICGSVTVAIGNAATTFCAQNMGAGNIDRIKKGVRTGVVVAVGYSIVAFLIVMLFGRTLALLFIDAESTDLINLTYQYMVTCAAFYWAVALIHVVRLSIQGLGYGTIVMIAGLLEMVARGAVGIVFVPIFGFTAACFASPAAWVIADLFIIPSFVIAMRRAAKRIANEREMQSENLVLSGET
ncbi:MATE family efflux transporter [Lederbergia citri]|uniref:Probable multidrug resistance protein NorM n=1 Tax=Lederbergia citri TaxID=2833580 RepID=A0A942TKW5_9BACI|nr:MATE family efflux transporter [Lederbergia citri]MBS4197902.1 MATE family efflux transporter [Lederbergia citri]